jgi:hypothetical protein
VSLDDAGRPCIDRKANRVADADHRQQIVERRCRMWKIEQIDLSPALQHRRTRIEGTSRDGSSASGAGSELLGVLGGGSTARPPW